MTFVILKYVFFFFFFFFFLGAFGNWQMAIGKVIKNEKKISVGTGRGRGGCALVV